jgi:hypothetical protein
MRTDGSNEIDDGDVIVVSYDAGNMPPQHRKRYANSIRRAVKKTFPKNRIFVHDKSITISILR